MGDVMMMGVMDESTVLLHGVVDCFAHGYSSIGRRRCVVRVTRAALPLCKYSVKDTRLVALLPSYQTCNGVIGDILTTLQMTCLSIHRFTLELSHVFVCYEFMICFHNIISAIKYEKKKFIYYYHAARSIY